MSGLRSPNLGTSHCRLASPASAMLPCCLRAMGRCPWGWTSLSRGLGGSPAWWHQPIAITPLLLLPPGVHAQSNPAVAGAEPGNLCMIKVSLAKRNAVKMSTVKDSPAPLVTCASG